LQFSLQAASPETFGYTLLHRMKLSLSAQFDQVILICVESFMRHSTTLRSGKGQRKNSFFQLSPSRFLARTGHRFLSGVSFGHPQRSSPCSFIIPWCLTPSSRVLHLASQEITRFLWNPKFHYSVHQSPPLLPILSQMNAFENSHSTPLTSILTFSSHLHLGLTNKILYAFLISSVLATCPAHLILPDLITLITLGDSHMF
jgi:hypothetical protein